MKAVFCLISSHISDFRKDESGFTKAGVKTSSVRSHVKDVIRNILNIKMSNNVLRLPQMFPMMLKPREMYDFIQALIKSLLDFSNTMSVNKIETKEEKKDIAYLKTIFN